MRDYINPEGKSMQLFYKITEMMLLSLLWIVASLPIFTVGAASSAIYYAVVKVIRNQEGRAWTEFWRGFRINFKQATIIWILFVLLLGGLVVDIIIMFLLPTVGVGSRWGTIPFALALAFGVMWLQYVFAYVARFEDKTKTVLYNTFWMNLFHFLHSVFLLVILAVLAGAAFLFPIVLPFAIFFFPGLYTVIAAAILESRFKVHMPKQEIGDSEAKEGVICDG